MSAEQTSGPRKRGELGVVGGGAMGAGIAAACLLRELPVTMIERDKGSRNAEHIMKLVEVITSDHASPTALVTVFALAKPLGKIAVPSGVCDGFIGSRIMSA